MKVALSSPLAHAPCRFQCAIHYVTRPALLLTSCSWVWCSQIQCVAVAYSWFFNQLLLAVAGRIRYYVLVQVVAIRCFPMTYVQFPQQNLGIVWTLSFSYLLAKTKCFYVHLTRRYTTLFPIHIGYVRVRFIPSCTAHYHGVIPLSFVVSPMLYV